MVAVPKAQASTFSASISVSKLCLRVNFDHFSRPAKKSYPYRPQSNAIISCHLLCSSSINILPRLYTFCQPWHHIINFITLGALFVKPGAFSIITTEEKVISRKTHNFRGVQGAREYLIANLRSLKSFPSLTVYVPKTSQ